MPGSVLPLGKMEVNAVAGMVALTKSQTTLNDEKPSLADLDTEDDVMDSQGGIMCKRAMVSKSSGMLLLCKTCINYRDHL